MSERKNQENCEMGRVIIFSAPSGTGKSTIIHYLIDKGLRLSFSVSATSRKPRAGEKDGVDYYFLPSVEDFEKKIADGEFLEYEQVYAGLYYGTLRRPVDEMLKCGQNVVFDIDVKGAMNIKRHFGNRALSLFISPPDIDTLRYRLLSRGTETPESLAKRLERAKMEMSFAPKFDFTVVNDDLPTAEAEVEKIVARFLKEPIVQQ